MQWHQLWYVLAGLILGLTASTLWEWLHFRRKRMELRDRRVLELEAEVRFLRQQNQQIMQLAARPTPPAIDYQSPAVFLENEEAESLRDDEYAPQYDDAQPAAPVAEAVVVETPAVETLAVETPLVEEARYIPPTASTLASAPDDEPEPVPVVEAEAVIDAESDPGDDTGINTVDDETVVDKTVADENLELLVEEYRTVQSQESPTSPVVDAEADDSIAGADEVAAARPDPEQTNEEGCI